MSTPPSKKLGSPKHEAVLENRYLPDDILCNIFMRLPGKLLAQMKALCKSLNALISQPSFIKSHLHHSIHHRHDEIFLVFVNGAFSNKEPLKFTAHSSRCPHIQLTDFIKPPPLDTSKPNNDPRFSEVIGSVNGLICFSARKGGEYGIYIWNPSLSALIDIPPFTIPEDLDDFDIHLQFGFDPKNDDYKIFKIMYHVGAAGYMFAESVLLEVYSIKKGSWEWINVSFPSHITLICNQSEVVVDGHDGRLHWICYAGNQTSIVTFDLGAETFTEISLPASIKFGAYNFVGVLSEKLCVISMSSVDKDSDVWVMDTYGVAESWAKQHVLKERITGSIIPLGFTLSNKFLCKVRDDDLAMYDPNTDAFKLFKTKSMTENVTSLAYHRMTKIVPYVESLVWPVKAPTERVGGVAI